MLTSRRMYLLRPAATSSSSMLVLRAFCGGLCARRSIANGHAATCSKKCPLADSSRSLVHADHPWLLESFPARCQTSVHSACACLGLAPAQKLRKAWVRPSVSGGLSPTTERAPRRKKQGLGARRSFFFFPGGGGSREATTRAT